MFGDPRELLESRILSLVQALSIADGLPEPFRFVTREMWHLGDIGANQLPLCLIEFEEPEVVPRLSHVYEVTLPGRLIVGFAPTVDLPASTANAYRLTLERMLMEDIHLGGLCDLVSLRGTLMPGLWADTGLLGLGVLFSILFEYDPRAAVVTA